MENPIIDVAVAVIVDNDLVVVAERPAGSATEGFWEFPGGKREAGESLDGALKREVYEETGLRIEPLKLLEMKVIDSIGLPDRKLKLHFWLCETSNKEELSSKENQNCCWLPVKKLRDLKMLHSNADVVNWLVDSLE